MQITAARSNLGLSASASVTSTGVNGSVEIGTFSNALNLTGCDVAYSVRAVIADTAEFVINTAENDTSGSSAFVLGTAQVETATASGTITLVGNATVTVTAAGLLGSPKAISVAVANADTAATWAGKVRTALSADSAVAALFAISGATTAIILTRKVTSLGLLPGNDSTLNIALANGTCTGITAAPTSANTTAGVASQGALISDGDGEDFEGVTIPTLATIKGILIKCTAGLVVLTSLDEIGGISAGETRVIVSNTHLPTFNDDLTFTSTGSSEVSITVIGSTI